MFNSRPLNLFSWGAGKWEEASEEVSGGLEGGPHSRRGWGEGLHLGRVSARMEGFFTTSGDETLTNKKSSEPEKRHR